jgi:hypothetical protein
MLDSLATYLDERREHKEERALVRIARRAFNDRWDSQTTECHNCHGDVIVTFDSWVGTFDEVCVVCDKFGVLSKNTSETPAQLHERLKEEVSKEFGVSLERL